MSRWVAIFCLVLVTFTQSAFAQMVKEPIDETIQFTCEGVMPTTECCRNVSVSGVLKKRPFKDPLGKTSTRYWKGNVHIHFDQSFTPSGTSDIDLNDALFTGRTRSDGWMKDLIDLSEDLNLEYDKEALYPKNHDYKMERFDSLFTDTLQIVLSRKGGELAKPTDPQQIPDESRLLFQYYNSADSEPSATYFESLTCRLINTK